MTKYFNAIRNDDNGEVDDIAISCDLFRLERMDDGVWWAAAYRNGKRTTFDLYVEEGKLMVRVVENDLGAKED